MATYSPRTVLVPSGLDEAGLRLGMTRLPAESLFDFRRRCLLEARSPSGASQREFINSVNRQVGLFDVPAFTVDVVRTGGEPDANDPYVEITSSFVRVYSDYSSGVPDLELEFKNYRFVSDIVTAINAHSDFTCTAIGAAGVLASRNLRYENNKRYVHRQALLAGNSNYLGKTLVRDFWADNNIVFKSQKNTATAVGTDGDWYLDGTNGVVITHLPQAGEVSFSYVQFPFRVYWQPVRAYPCNDADIDYLHKDLLYDDDGEQLPLKLNSEGAEVINALYGAHPLQWGI